MDCDELQIQRLEQNLDQLCMWLARLFFAAGGEPSGEHYFMDKLLLTEACSDASDASDAGIIVITWCLYHNNSESFALAVGYILKLFCMVLPVGYCEVMFLCISFL